MQHGVQLAVIDTAAEIEDEYNIEVLGLIGLHTGHIVLGNWGVIVNGNAQGAVGSVTVLIRDLIVEGEGLVVFLIGRCMQHRGILGNVVRARSAVQGDGQHSDCALFDQQ